MSFIPFRLFFFIPCVSVLLFAAVQRPATQAPHNVLLARGLEEPMVAVDPTRPATIVIGSNPDYSHPIDGGYPNAYFTSHDSGRTFSADHLPTLQPYVAGADPTVAIARTGTTFYSYLGAAPGHYSCSGCVCTGAGRSAAVLVSRSTDAGTTFKPATIVDVDAGDDKPSMAVQSVPGRKSHVFVAWTRQGNTVYFARSLDGGFTFSQPVVLYSSKASNYSAVPVVGPHGHIYVVWTEFLGDTLAAPGLAKLRVATSLDDGGQFRSIPHTVATIHTIPLMLEPGSLRTLTAPTVAAGPGGTLYVAWPESGIQHPNGAVDVDIKLSRSRDEGATWSAPVAVNDSHVGDRFMPAMSILPDGSLGIAFYDRRDGPDTLDVYAAHVLFHHGLRQTPNLRVNQGPSNVADLHYIKPGGCYSPGRFFGDYLSVSAGGGSTLCVTWADTQLHVPEQTDLWFARVTLRGFR
jgi:hypothetical protein